MHLLCRFYAPTSGGIQLDGTPIEAFRLADVAPADCAGLTAGGAVQRYGRTNVAFGQQDRADDASLRQALETAQAWEFVEALPNGLDTVLGDGGDGLSGGQRQRLAIARAVLKDAPILILDEATSALDNESEAAIQASLEQVATGRTTLVIAHRLSTVERADLIVVMDQGRIVAADTHEALMAEMAYTRAFISRVWAAMSAIRSVLERVLNTSGTGVPAFTVTVPLSWPVQWVVARRRARAPAKHSTPEVSVWVGA